MVAQAPAERGVHAQGPALAPVLLETPPAVRPPAAPDEPSGPGDFGAVTPRAAQFGELWRISAGCLVPCLVGQRKAPLMLLSRTNLLIAAWLVEYPDEIPCLY